MVRCLALFEANETLGYIIQQLILDCTDETQERNSALGRELFYANAFP